MPSIIACDQASMSAKATLVRPVISFSASAETGMAKSRTRSAAPRGARSSRMRAQWPSKRARQWSRTVFGETVGKMARRSAVCASPSLRIMFCPISRFIRPPGWSEENTAMFFSHTAMSSRRVNNVAPNCGTKAIGQASRIAARSG